MIYAVVLVLVIVILGLVLALRRKDGASTGSKGTTERDPAAIARGEIDSSLNRLADLSLGVRLASFPSGAVSVFDRIVDKLIVLWPKMKMEYPADELTYIVGRMTGEYLTGLVTPYEGLSQTSRTEQLPELMDVLNGLDGELDRILKIVESQQVNQFQVQASFLRQKFFGESLDASGANS